MSDLFIATLTKLEVDRVNVTVAGAFPQWVQGRLCATLTGENGEQLVIPDYRGPLPKIGDRFHIEITEPA